MKTKYRIKSWEKMVEEFGIESRGSINCKIRFTENMKPLCGMTVEKDCEELYGYTISLDVIEEYTEYEVGDAIKVRSNNGLIVTRYYVCMIGDRVLTVEYPDHADPLVEGEDWGCCRTYDRIIEEPKEEYLDLSANIGRVFVDEDGEVFQSTSSFSEEWVKNWHNAGGRLLVSIDLETGKAVTKSLKVGEE
jgi:hypothetical protein